jgi:hypothetical protein
LDGGQKNGLNATMEQWMENKKSKNKEKNKKK